MKRRYVKPYLMVEPYQLDASIAEACSSNGGTPIYYGEGNCMYMEYFYSSQCPEDVVHGDCYHGPEATDGITFVMS